MVAITDQEFAQFQRFIFESAGITLSPAKKALVSGRLARRLDLHDTHSYGDYFRLLSSGKAPQEVQMAIDQRARAGHYPMERARHVSQDYLRRFCLKGEGEQDGTLLVEKNLRNKVKFLQVNLNEPLPNIGTFDVVFLRNVLIYFNAETKRRVVERVLSVLQPGGWLLIGHSESLHGVSDSVHTVAPSIYRKP
jgi:chemotaxis methyl-accepting protein methylase